jgi:DNA gyrase subunit A
VRCQRFLKGEDALVSAFAVNTPARAAGVGGAPVDLPDATGRRDGSGAPTSAVIARVAGPVLEV